MFEDQTSQKYPLIIQAVGAGFQTIVDDYIEEMLDLNAFLIAHPAATFFVRVEGDSMERAGIYSGDLLIVDRALEAKNGNIIVGIYDGEFTVKRMIVDNGVMYLQSESQEKGQRFRVQEDMLEVWGVVAHVIHHVL